MCSKKSNLKSWELSIFMFQENKTRTRILLATSSLTVDNLIFSQWNLLYSVYIKIFLAQKVFCL